MNAGRGWGREKKGSAKCTLLTAIIKIALHQRESPKYISKHPGDLQMQGYPERCPAEASKSAEKNQKQLRKKRHPEQKDGQGDPDHNRKK